MPCGPPTERSTTVTSTRFSLFHSFLRTSLPLILALCYLQVNGDNTFAIRFDDGDFHKGIELDKVLNFVSRDFDFDLGIRLKFGNHRSHL